jgi:hypothetical protein
MLPRIPVSRVCPECAVASFKRAAPGKGRFFILVHDRTCLACGTRYTPPAHPVIAILAMVNAVPFMVGGAYVIAVPLASGTPSGLLVAAPVGMLIVWLGVASLRLAVRSFFERAEDNRRGFAVLLHQGDEHSSGGNSNESGQARQ